MRLTHLRAASRRGFTLLELMTVVVIVAILAVVAIVAYRALLRSARGTEAIHVVGSIRVAQEKYKQETDNINYLDVSTAIAYAPSTGMSSLYPTGATPGNRKYGWGAPCASGCTSTNAWSLLTVDTDGPVMFGYTTKAYGSAAVPPAVTIDGTAITYPSPITQNYYVVTAVGDPDGAGTYCTVFGSSFNNQIFTEASCK